MSFMLLPPEINSGRIYSGPGSGPMRAAAAAWRALAADLYSTAQQYSMTVAELVSGPWEGPSAARMETAAAPQVAWLHTAAGQAEQTADQVRAAVTAYDTAFARTVPPPLIAANRARYLMLTATNVFGQNAPAIADTEAEYAEMWAQDVEAMRDYAAASAVNSTLTPFAPPQQYTDPGAQQGQGAAVAQAAAAAQGVDMQAVLAAGRQLLSAGPQTLQSLASQATPLPPFLEWLYSLNLNPDLGLLSGAPRLPLTSAFQSMFWIGITFGFSHSTYGLQNALIATGQAAPAAAAAEPASLLKSTAGAVSAAMGETNRVGGLSVSPSWTSGAPALRLAATALPMTSLTAVTGTGLFNGGMSPLGVMPLLAMVERGRRDDDSDDRESSDGGEERSPATN